MVRTAGPQEPAKCPSLQKKKTRGSGGEVITKIGSGQADRDGAGRRQRGGYVSPWTNPPPVGARDLHHAPLLHFVPVCRQRPGLPNARPAFHRETSLTEASGLMLHDQES